MDNIKILEKVKSDYDRISNHFNITRQNDWQEFELFKTYITNYIYNTNIKKIRVLDVGCGNGRLVKFLNSLGIEFEYLGIDNSEEQIKTAKKNYEDIENVKFEEGNILSLENYKDKFNVIFCIAVFHHLPKELQEKGAEQIKLALKKEGLIFMLNWNLFQRKYIKNVYNINKIFKYKTLNLKNTFITWKKPNGELICERFYYAFSKKDLNKIFKKVELNILENKFSDNKNRHKARNIVTVLRR